MPNLELQPKRTVSAFRRIALGTWSTVGDPSVYGTLTLRVDESLRYVEEYRQATGRRLTLTHLMCKAMGEVFREMPDANAILRFNRIYLRQRISVFFQVALEDEGTGEIDLSGVLVEDADRKDLATVIDEFEAKVGTVRRGADASLERTRQTFKRLPYFLLKPFLTLVGFLSYTLNLDLRALGLPKDAFGSVMVTNIGSLGIDEAYVPLVPYSRIALLIAMGAVKEEAVVEEGEIRVARLMRLNATFDHRVLDGSHCVVMSRVLRRCFEHPDESFGAIPAPAGAGVP